MLALRTFIRQPKCHWVRKAAQPLQISSQRSGATHLPIWSCSDVLFFTGAFQHPQFFLRSGRFGDLACLPGTFAVRDWALARISGASNIGMIFWQTCVATMLRQYSSIADKK